MNSPRNLLTAAPAVVTMLIVQMAVLISSLNNYYEISIFCTGPDHGWLQWIFALLHVSFLVLVAVGMISLKWRAARPFYLLILIVGLAALPVQAKLVHAGTLQCDVP